MLIFAQSFELQQNEEIFVDKGSATVFFGGLGKKPHIASALTKTGWNIFDITLLAENQSQDCGHIIPTIHRYAFINIIK